MNKFGKINYDENLTNGQIESLYQMDFEKKILIEWIDHSIEQYKRKEIKDLSMVELLNVFVKNISDPNLVKFNENNKSRRDGSIYGKN